MAPHREDSEDEESPLTEEDYEEGLDDDYDDEEDEEYEEDADLVDDDGLEDEDVSGVGQSVIKGLEPLEGTGTSGAQSARSSDGVAVKPWTGLESLPVATREAYVKLLGQLREQKKQKITMLVLGKHFTGKTATVNSLLNESAAGRPLAQRTTTPPAHYSREAHGFTLDVIDASGLNDLDAVSEREAGVAPGLTLHAMQRLQAVVQSIRDTTIDVLLYVDRLDLYRVDGSDEQIFRGITRALGSDIWKNAIIGLTHATATVNGYAWGDFAAQRGERLQRAVRRHAGCPAAELPVALIENSAACPKDEAGQKQLPDGSAWLPGLMEKVVSVATSRPAYKHDPVAVAKAANPNRKLRWLIPIVFAAQIAFKVFVLDRLMADDALTGDRSGPFDAPIIRANRARAAAEKAAARDRASRAVQRSAVVAAYDSDSDVDSD